MCFYSYLLYCATGGYALAWLLNVWLRQRIVTVYVMSVLLALGVNHTTIKMQAVADFVLCGSEPSDFGDAILSLFVVLYVPLIVLFIMVAERLTYRAVRTRDSK